jgi:hypothetical protein
MNFGKIILWIGSAFFWGIGIVFAGVIINELFFEITDNVG